MPKCKFIKKNSDSKCWFSPVFMVDTEILFGYKFVAPLTNKNQK